MPLHERITSWMVNVPTSRSYKGMGKRAMLAYCSWMIWILQAQLSPTPKLNLFCWDHRVGKKCSIRLLLVKKPMLIWMDMVKDIGLSFTLRPRIMVVGNGLLPRLLFVSLKMRRHCPSLHTSKASKTLSGRLKIWSFQTCSNLQLLFFWKKSSLNPLFQKGPIS